MLALQTAAVRLVEVSGIVKRRPRPLEAQNVKPQVRMMYVYYTVDTEFWPQTPSNPDFSGADDDFQRDVYGTTRDGEYGIRYQMDALESEGLKGVFFLETLHALRLGTMYLREMVDAVQSRGHEAALHIHPEWLQWLDKHPLGGRNSQLVKDFPAADQQWITRRAVELLNECGVARAASFRAGNYGADRNTLRALASEGVGIDSSYNIAFVGGDCGIDTEAPLTCPTKMEGLIEVPISFIQDLPGHYRPMQIMAASLGEMRAALEGAYQRGFPSFVFVSHGFELIRRNREQRGGARCDSIVRRRFDELVKYLGKNKDRYQVTTFAETVSERLFPRISDDTPVKGSAFRTYGRIFEQLARRVAARIM
jgi:hypothetical protein